MIFLRETLRICAVGSASVGHAQDFAAWKKVNKDGSWTLAAKSTIKATKLVTLVPKDIKIFCLAYYQLDAHKRMRFWVSLLSAMAKPDSGFKPETKYVEPDIVDASKQSVVSRGLLQISMESANQKAYGCGIQQTQVLRGVDVNLNCAAQIMQHWVEKDDFITATSKPAVVLARYWSALRAWCGHPDEIASFTKGMEACKP